MQRQHAGRAAMIVFALLVGGIAVCACARSIAATPPQAAQAPTAAPAARTLGSTAAPDKPVARPTLEGTPPPAGAARVYADGMTGLFVPAGEFLMGTADPSWIEWPDEKPQRSVFLDAFWMDRTEVTNAMYARCVKAGACSPPNLRSSYTRESYFGSPAYDGYPVIHVYWDAARQYCQWAGRRLPTEAEWEKATGPDGRRYPWGNEAPDASRGNVNDSGDTTLAGSYPAGASPYGMLDAAGNVWEWVSDFYADSYYKYAPHENPPGPDFAASFHVLRGGQWSVAQRSALSSDRYGYGYRALEDRTGFRCAL